MEKIVSLTSETKITFLSSTDLGSLVLGSIPSEGKHFANVVGCKGSTEEQIRSYYDRNGENEVEDGEDNDTHTIFFFQMKNQPRPGIRPANW